MKNIYKILGIIVLSAIIGFSMIACDDGDDKGGLDNNLILPNGWAWTDHWKYGTGNSDGYVFKSNGTVVLISDYGHGSNGTWGIDETINWSTRNGIITFSEGTRSESDSYSISGDTLTLAGDYVLKKHNIGTTF